MASNKKRIAFLGDALDLQYAGVHVYLRGLLGALTAKADGNEYILVRPKTDGPTFPHMQECIVPIRAAIPGHQYWRAFTSIPKELVRQGVDVVVEPAHFGPFRLPAHVQRVTIIHDLTPVLFPHYHSLASSAVHKIVLPGIFKKASHILANSNYTMQDIEKHYPVAQGKISVVQPGADAIFKPASDEAVLQKYGIRAPYILYVGTLEPRKNLLALLRAYEGLRKSGPYFQLVFVGKKGWKNQAFFGALEASPFREDIVLTGYAARQELPVLYSMARLFVYPSLYEGFGLPVLEAMSCGAPVLVSSSSSLPEVGGTAAAYFEVNDQEGFVNKLCDLATNEYRLSEMRRLSLAQAARFSWEAGAEKFRSILSKL